MSNRSGTVAVALLAGAAVTLIYFGGQGDQADREREEIKKTCLTKGAVDEKCPNLFPEIERCTVEDCSDVKGNVGYFQDPSDKSGRSWFFVIRPEMQEAPQRPEQS